MKNRGVWKKKVAFESNTAFFSLGGRDGGQISFELKPFFETVLVYAPIFSWRALFLLNAREHKTRTVE